MEASDNSVPVSITLLQAQSLARRLLLGEALPSKTPHDKAMLVQYGIAMDALLNNQSVIFALEPVLGVPVTLNTERIGDAQRIEPEPLTSET